MPAIQPVPYQTLVRIFEKDGFRFSRQSRIEPQVDTNVFADQAARHLVEAGDHFVQAEDLRLHHLMAAERQELPRQVRGALCGLENLVDLLPLGAGGGKLLVQELAVALLRSEMLIGVATGFALQTIWPARSAMERFPYCEEASRIIVNRLD